MRVSMITFLIQAAHAACSVTLRTGHSNTTTMNLYHILFNSYGVEEMETIGGVRYSNNNGEKTLDFIKHSAPEQKNAIFSVHSVIDIKREEIQ